MKIAAVICNVLLLAFTCVVLALDGLPTEPVFIVFTVWLLLTVIFSGLVIARRPLMAAPTATTAVHPHTLELHSTHAALRFAAFVANIILLLVALWALTRQYPHPHEQGFVPYVVLLLLTPVLNLIELFRNAESDGWLHLHAGAH